MNGIVDTNSRQAIPSSNFTVVCFGLTGITLMLIVTTNKILQENNTVNVASAPIDTLLKHLKIADRNISFTDDLKRHAHTFNIMWYAYPTWVKPFRSLDKCEFQNCIISFDRRDIKHSDLVLFHHTDMNIPPPAKEDDQKWVFVSIEALPLTHRYYRHKRWKDKFDWTMTYRSDSEGYAPYGTIMPTKETKRRNYTSIFANKTKDIAWLVSNCRTTSKRMEYVKRMQKIIQVDIFGKCGIPCAGRNCFQNLSNVYKFYLAFENTICEDYVTEKLFQNFNDDYNFVPVVRGAPNINHLVPVKSFISASDFKSPEELAIYLKVAGSNETIYSSYLKTKHKFISTMDPIGLGMCALCEKLNAKFERNEKLNLVKMLSERPCYKPNDL